MRRAAAFGILGGTALIMAAACADPNSPVELTPTAVSIVGGNDQTRSVNSALSTPLAIRITDAQGKPLSGVTVRWSVASGGGNVSPTSSTSDTDGAAQSSWTLGSTPGQQTTVATVSGLPAVTFTATATYSVAGFVRDETGAGIGAVTVDLGPYGRVSTSTNGAWSKDGLTSAVTITAQKTGWNFTPARRDVTGPGDGLTFTGSVTTGIETLVKVVVRWDQVATIGLQQLMHLGARMEYPADSTFFARSATRLGNETHGIITLAVPPTSKARLFVTAVQYDIGPSGADSWKRNQVVWLGVIDSVRVVDGQTRVITFADITWIQPSWQVIDQSKSAELLAGRMEAAKSANDLRFDIRILDPFQDGLNPPYADLFVGINGTSGSTATLSNGYRRYEIVCANASVGQGHLSTCHFFPFLRGERFNLPPARYAITPLVDPFQVEWK